MRQLFSIAICLCFVSYGFSAPAESASTSTHEKPTVPLTDTSKPSEVKPSTETRTAGSPEEVDKQRTHSGPNLIFQQLRGLTNSLQQSPNILAPSIGPISPIVSSPAISSYSYGGYGGYGYPSKILPSYGYGSSYVSPVSHSLPVVAPAAVQTAHVPVVSQAIVSKPVVSVNEHVVQQPVYSVSQQVIHKPVFTEIVEIVRRPVVTEVEEIIHKPVVTELQQVIKKPLYTQHVVKTPSYGSIKQEVYQAPLHLQGDSVHVVDKPVSQFIELPTKVVQPVAAHVVQTPVVHQQLSTATVVSSKPVTTGVIGSYPSYGYGGYGYGSGFGYGSGLSSYGYGSGIGYGSGFGYGSGLSSSYGYGYPFSYSGASLGGESVYQYLSPSSSCRATGTCPRDAESTEKSFITGPSGAVAAPMPYTNLESQMPWNNIFSGPPTYISSPIISPLTDQPIIGQKQSQPAGPMQTTQNSDNPALTSTIVENIRNDPEALKEFQALVQKFSLKYAKSQPQNTEQFDVQGSLKMIEEAAKSNPTLWGKMFNTEFKPKLQSMEKIQSDPLRKSN